jgi:hypothetical protein
MIHNLPILDAVTIGLIKTAIIIKLRLIGVQSCAF